MRQIAMTCCLFSLAVAAAADLVTEAPVVTARCAPVYTPQARRSRIEGTVVLYVEVGLDGRAHHIRVQRSLEPALDRNAVEAVRQWRFRPGTKMGEVTKTAASIEVPFRLKDDTKPCRAVPDAQVIARN